MTNQLTDQENEMIVLSFEIENQLYGVDIFDIINVTRVNTSSLYSIPMASKEVIGMYSKTEEVFPVFDLQLLLNYLGFDYPRITTEWISVIKIKVKGFTSGLGLQTEPDFNTIERNNVSDSKDTGLKATWNMGDKECMILDLGQLFPNVKLNDKSQVTSQDENDLDLSQYLLEE